ncbi:MAG: crossover junction endodeoxyribonuclease RuvC [Gemmatimonadota bacterium]
MLVLGIDPGTAVTGYGLVERLGDGSLRLVECGVIRTSPKTPLALRLREIFEGVSELMQRHAPHAVAVEGVFFGKNARSAMVLGHARGAVLLAASLQDRDVAEYPPAEVKNAIVGSGNATKHQIGFMTQKLLRLREPPRPEDAADGVAVALCHCFRGGFGRSLETPLVHTPRGAAR